MCLTRPAGIYDGVRHGHTFPEVMWRFVALGASILFAGFDFKDVKDLTSLRRTPMMDITGGSTPGIVGRVVELVLLGVVIAEQPGNQWLSLVVASVYALSARFFLARSDYFIVGVATIVIPLGVTIPAFLESYHSVGCGLLLLTGINCYLVWKAPTQKPPTKPEKIEERSFPFTPGFKPPNSNTEPTRWGTGQFKQGPSAWNIDF